MSLKSAEFGVKRQLMAISPNIYDFRPLECEFDDNVSINHKYMCLVPSYGLVRADRSKDWSPNTNPKITTHIDNQMERTFCDSHILN